MGERGGKSSRGRRKEEKEGGRECGVREADEAETGKGAREVERRWREGREKTVMEEVERGGRVRIV